MQIVIDIPEKTYKELKAVTVTHAGEQFAQRLIRYIIRGTPLQQRHGRLIDADNLIKLYETYCGNNCPYSKKEREFMCRACQTGDAIEMLEDEPTIIPADKEKEE